jgi:hypothetical protein
LGVQRIYLTVQEGFEEVRQVPVPFSWFNFDDGLLQNVHFVLLIEVRTRMWRAFAAAKGGFITYSFPKSTVEWASSLFTACDFWVRIW